MDQKLATATTVVLFPGAEDLVILKGFQPPEALDELTRRIKQSLLAAAPARALRGDVRE